MRRKSERNSSSSSTTSRRSSRRKQTEDNVDDEQIQQTQTEEEQVSSTTEPAAAAASTAVVCNNDNEQSEKVSENEKSETGVEVITKRTKTSTQQPDSSSDREESGADVLSTRRTPSKRARTPGKGRQNTRRNRAEKIQTIEEENGNEEKEAIISKDQVTSERENKQQPETEFISSPKEIIVTENVTIVNQEKSVESKNEINNEVDSKSQELETPVDQSSELDSNKDEQKRKSRKISNSSPTKKLNEEEPKEVKKPPRKSRFDERPKDLQAEIEQNKISEELQMEKSKNVAKINLDHDQQYEAKTKEQVVANEISKEPQQIAENHKKTIEIVLEKPQRKRKWLSRKPSAEHVLAITTDSLKELISDVVHPVPLSDVKLDSSPEHEEVSIVIDEKTLAVVNCDEDNETEVKTNNNSSLELVSPKQRQHSKDRSANAYRRSNSRDRSIERNSREKKVSISANRKISIVGKQRPPSPSRNISSSILYITNLVRPFTVLQLKGLLARTGKIVEENGFWIDRIKSKCFVRYETEDEAIETRHALHGVRWPTSNPKCLNVDFGTEIAMEKAIASTVDEQPKINRDSVKDNRIMGTGWDKDRLDFDREKREVQIRPVREWDVGKKDDFDRDSERNRGRNDRNGGRNSEREKDQLVDRDREDRRDRERNREQHERGRRQSSDRENHRRRSESGSPVRKYRKKENEPPLRLLDDLFRKTKTTPCVYWLPLTPEQIAEKDKIRQKRIEEREKIRQEREREREKERRDKRSRSRNKRY